MGRETQRRLALLAAVGALAVAWTVVVESPGVADVANAAAPKKPHATVVTLRACPFPARLRGMFEAAAKDTGLPQGMLFAVAKVESNLHPDALSSAGARGLLQVMPATARSLDLDPDEPQSNVLAGARYLRQLLDRFNSTDLALAAYNAGPTAVAAAGGAPSLAVVRYVANVNAEWRSVAGCE